MNDIIREARAYFRANPDARSCDIVTVNPVYRVQLLGEPEMVRTHVTRSQALRTSSRSARDQAMRDLGMVKVRGSLGGTYYE